MIFGVSKKQFIFFPPQDFLQPSELARMHHEESVAALWIFSPQTLYKDTSCLPSHFYGDHHSITP